MKLERIPCCAAVVATLTPNLGFLLAADLTPENSRWFRTLTHPTWGVSTGRIYFPTLLIANLLQGYAGFLIWAANIETTTPLILYGVQLSLLWLHYPIFLGCQSLKWGFVDITATFVTAAVTSAMFWGIDSLAGMCMTPHVALLVYDVFRDGWMFFNNPKDNQNGKKPAATLRRGKQ